MKKVISIILATTILFTMLISLTSCGTKSSKGLEFKSNGDGTCTWVGLGTCTDTEIVVPEKNGDDTVVSVGEEVLDRKEGITKVSLPNTVTTLEENALAYNDDLLEIDFGNGLETIEADAVAYCDNLQKASLPDGLKKIGRRAFSSDVSLTEIIIPESIEVVENGAFSETTSVKKISIPSKMNEFSTFVFCTESLEELELKGEMKFFTLSVNMDNSISGGICKEPEKTQYPNTYTSVCTNDNIASVIFAILGKEKIKLNGEEVAPSTNIENGSYSKENNMYAFEITESQELVVSFGAVQKNEIARLKYQINNETKTYSVKGSSTFQNETLNLDIMLVPFGNSFFIVMNVTDTTGSNSEVISGLWNKS